MNIKQILGYSKMRTQLKTRTVWRGENHHPQFRRLTRWVINICRCGRNVPKEGITPLWGSDFKFTLCETLDDFEMSLDRMDFWTSFWDISNIRENLVNFSISTTNLRSKFSNFGNYPLAQATFRIYGYKWTQVWSTPYQVATKKSGLGLSVFTSTLKENVL